MEHLDKELLQRIVDTWGTQAQIDQAIEEMAELIQALQKLKRTPKSDGVEEYDHACEEIADVSMMMDQLRHIFSKEKVMMYQKQKTDRIIERLNKPK